MTQKELHTLLIDVDCALCGAGEELALIRDDGADVQSCIISELALTHNKVVKAIDEMEKA